MSPDETADIRADEEGLCAFFSSVEDQQALNSSTASAVLALVEYFERRACGRTFEGSKLFLYKMARTLRRTRGDCGVDLRTTFKALVRFGAPPYDMWHTDPSRFDDEPHDVSLIGFARDYADTRYVRLDFRDHESTGYECGKKTLFTVKSFLAAGFPVAFGFSVPHSLTTCPHIPYRPSFESYRGGGAVVAVGYNDNRDTSPKGAILVRTCWGDKWGEKGYGWLPYAYVEKGLARDFWTLVREAWLDPTEFKAPLLLFEDENTCRDF